MNPEQIELFPRFELEVLEGDDEGVDIESEPELTIVRTPAQWSEDLPSYGGSD